jgi:TonB family protein
MHTEFINELGQIVLKSTRLRLLSVGSVLVILPIWVTGGTIALPPAATHGQGSTTPKAQAPPFSVGMEVMSDPAGVDLGPFLRRMYASIKDKAMSSMPKSVAEGDQGVVKIRFRVKKDGTFEDSDLPKLEFRSGKKTLDDHALAAIRSAVPFDHLPNSLSSVELRLTFFYNMPVPQP